MCDPYYEDCPAVCDPYYEDCPKPNMMKDDGMKGDMKGDWEDEEISHMPFFALWGTSALMVFGSFYDYTENIVDRTDGDNYKGMFYATQLAWIPVFVTTSMHMFV